MAEVAGLVLGAVGVAGLYGACLQVLDQIYDARNFEQGFELVRAKFRVAKHLLQVWGEGVGIGADGQLASQHHPKLDDDKHLAPVSAVLGCVRQLFADAGKGIDKYDARGGNKLRWKALWAVKDRKKLEGLVVELLALVESLGDLIENDERPDTRIGEQLLAEIRIVRDSIDSEARERAGDKYRSRLRKERKRRMKVLKWLGAVSTEETYKRTLHDQHPGTCSWILKAHFFQEWMKAPHSAGPSFLWIHGIPGGGKTFLAARILQHLQKVSLPRTPVAYFFCAHEDSEKCETTAVLRGWIQQIAQQSPEALQQVEKMYQEAELHSPGQHKLWELFKSILEVLPAGGYLVLDGLDECADHDPTTGYYASGHRAAFLEKLFKATETIKIHVLIVSRFEQSLQETFTQNSSSAAMMLEHAITKDDTSSDIQRLATSIVESKLPKRSLNFRTDLSKKLSSGCDGMFLLLRLERDRLKEGRSDHALQQVFSGAPLQLDRVYERELERILRLRDPEKIRRAETILKLAQSAARPLTVAELAEALVVRIGDKDINKTLIPDVLDKDFLHNEILVLGGCLIEFRPAPDVAAIGAGTIHLAHFSVKEFLSTTAKFGSRGSDTFLANLCLTYLSFDCFSVPFKKELCSGYMFLPYAARLWNTHLGDFQSIDTDLLGRTKRFLDIMGPHSNYTFWLHYYTKFLRIVPYRTPSILDVFLKIVPHRTPSLQEVFLENPDPGAYFEGPVFGSVHWHQWHLLHRVLHFFRWTRSPYMFLLRDVVQFGMANLIPVILDFDGVGDTFKYDSSTLYDAWSTATRYDHPCRLKRQQCKDELAEEGDPDFFSTEVLQAMLAHSRDLWRDEWIGGENLLQVAARAGDLGAVRLLLDLGMDINPTLPSDTSPVRAAALNGHRDVVRLLLERGADAAQSAWSVPTFFFLLDRIELVFDLRVLLAEMFQFWNHSDAGFGAFIWSLERLGHEEIVVDLLQRGLAFNSASWIRKEALAIAARCGDYHQVRKLLSKPGIDINTQGSWYGSALYTASYYGHTEIVELLLQHGADVNAKNKTSLLDLRLNVIEYKTTTRTFQWPFGPRSPKMGIRTNNPLPLRPSSFTALEAASVRGHIEIAALLLQNGGYKGVDVNAFYCACLGKSTALIDLFLSYDSNYAPDGNWQAWLRAAERSRPAIPYCCGLLVSESEFIWLCMVSCAALWPIDNMLMDSHKQVISHILWLLYTTPILINFQAVDRYFVAILVSSACLRVGMISVAATTFLNRLFWRARDRLFV